jgi:hypothetical protein
MSKIIEIVKKQVEPDSLDRLSRQEESEAKLDSPVAKKKGSGKSKSSKKKVSTIEEDPHLSIDGQTCIQIRSENLVDRVTNLIKPLNIPVNWDNCPIQTSSTYHIHVSIEAVFNPDSGIFDYVRTLEEPTQYHSLPCRRLRLEPTPPPILKAKTGGMVEGIGKGENVADSIVGGDG